MSPIFQPTAFLGESITGVSYDSSSIAFFERADITDVSLKNAINNLVVDLKNQSLWNKMRCIFPFVTDKSTSSGSLVQFQINLVNTASFSGGGSSSFVNGESQTQDKSGFKASSNTTTYMKTGLVPATVIGDSINPFHLSLYTNATGSETINVIDAGANGAGGAETNLYVGRTFAGTPASVWAPRGDIEIAAANQSVYKGHFVARTDYSASGEYRHRLARDGTEITGSNGNTTKGCGNVELYIGSANSAGSSVAIANKRYQFFSFGSSLTNAETTTFSTIVNDFQTAVDAIYSTTRHA
jgi:hypothetical protein